MKKWLLGAVIGVAALAMLAGDGIAVFLWTRKAPAAPAHAHLATRHESPLPPAHLYLATLPKFVAVLTTDGDGNSTYAEIAITFSAYDQRAVDAFGNVVPIIQAAIITEVMQDGSALSTGDETARKMLTHQALLAVNHIVEKTMPALGAEAFANAYLTDFLIQ
jgi:flagellar basal body-associated protein FliL